MNKPSCIKYISWNFKIPRFWKIGLVCASRLLRVWSIIPLFMQKISTRVVCVDGEHPPVLPRTSVMRLLRVWSIIPLFTHKISTRLVCLYGEATPVLPRTTVMRLLRVWSIVPLYTHTISTRVVCVNDKHPLFYPVLQLWRFCGFDVLYLFLWSARSS